MKENLKAILITLIFLLIGLSLFFFIFHDSTYKVGKFCEERGYSSYEFLSGIAGKYFNCCRNKLIIEEKGCYYKEEKECIAGGVIPKFWEKIGD